MDDEIYSATLTFKGVYNWRAEENFLYINLRDDADLGITEFDDPNPGFEDYFGGLDVPIATWSDPIGGYENRTNLSFKFNDLDLIEDLTNFALDGDVAFAFDPDCHYYVIEKVTFHDVALWRRPDRAGTHFPQEIKLRDNTTWTKTALVRAPFFFAFSQSDVFKKMNEPLR